MRLRVAAGNLCQSFLLSYGVRAGIGILLRAFKLARRRSYALHLNLKEVEEVVMFCPMICWEIVKNGTGSSKNHAIALLERVKPASLSLILDYCQFHQVPRRSSKERKTFDEQFFRKDTERQCELTSTSYSLQLKPLVDLTSRALAQIIEGKTPEEICDIFHLPDDLTEEASLRLTRRP